MNVKLFFDNGKSSILDVPEDALVAQISRPKKKRLYTCGIEFSAVESAQVIV